MNFASQQDMFSETSTDTGSVRPCSSLDPSNKKKKKEVSYFWVILFVWDVDEENPFSMHKISSFTKDDINPDWIQMNLGVQSRIKKLTNLSPFPGRTFSLFGKIEAGAPLKQRNGILDSLKSKFMHLSRLPGSDIGFCLRVVADSTPYRYLSNYTKAIFAAEEKMDKITGKPSSPLHEDEHLSPSILDRTSKIVEKQSVPSTSGSSSATPSSSLSSSSSSASSAPSAKKDSLPSSASSAEVEKVSVPPSSSTTSNLSKPSSGNTGNKLY